MLDGDVAQTLGAILREELLVESEILAIDGLVLRDFDYIDLGRVRMPSFTVPVTIKSLLFNEDPRRGRPPQRIHHHEHHSHDHGHGHHHGHDHDHRREHRDHHDHE
jgi:ethanolamine utilization protein EutA